MRKLAFAVLIGTFCIGTTNIYAQYAGFRNQQEVALYVQTEKRLLLDAQRRLTEENQRLLTNTENEILSNIKVKLDSME